jgi:hypothetical protein
LTGLGIPHLDELLDQLVSRCDPSIVAKARPEAVGN